MSWKIYIQRQNVHQTCNVSVTQWTLDNTDGTANLALKRIKSQNVVLIIKNKQLEKQTSYSLHSEQFWINCEPGRLPQTPAPQLATRTQCDSPAAYKTINIPCSMPLYQYCSLVYWSCHGSVMKGMDSPSLITVIYTNQGCREDRHLAKISQCSIKVPPSKSLYSVIPKIPTTFVFAKNLANGQIER